MLLSTNISNVGGMFVILEPFEERAGKPELSAPAVAGRAAASSSPRIQEAQVAVFGAPPVDGLGSTGGFKLQVQDRRGAGLRGAAGGRAEPGRAGQQRPAPGRPVQQLQRHPAAALRRHRPREGQGAGRRARASIYDTLQVYLGSAYVNDFTLPEPQLAGERPGRSRSSACRSRTSASLKVRNADGRHGAAARR